MVNGLLTWNKKERVFSGKIVASSMDESVELTLSLLFNCYDLQVLTMTKHNRYDKK